VLGEHVSQRDKAQRGARLWRGGQSLARVGTDSAWGPAKQAARGLGLAGCGGESVGTRKVHGGHALLLIISILQSSRNPGPGLGPPQPFYSQSSAATTAAAEAAAAATEQTETATSGNSARLLRLRQRWSQRRGRGQG
jgi:hypothetical protein